MVTPVSTGLSKMEIVFIFCCVLQHEDKGNLPNRTQAEKIY